AEVREARADESCGRCDGHRLQHVAGGLVVVGEVGPDTVVECACLEPKLDLLTLLRLQVGIAECRGTGGGSRNVTQCYAVDGVGLHGGVCGRGPPSLSPCAA